MRQLPLRMLKRWVDVITVGSLLHTHVTRQVPGVRVVLDSCCVDVSLSVHKSSDAATARPQSLLVCLPIAR